MSIIRVMIADDHVLVREGLRQLLCTQSDIVVVGEAGDGVEAMELARQLKPDVLLLDIAMPRMNGLEAVRLIHGASPDTRVVVLSMYEKESYAHQMLHAGVFGYVLKCEPSSDMLAAVRAAYARRFYFSDKVHREVIKGYVEGRPRGTVRSTGFDTLSDRERQVFFLIIEGNSSAQIGQVLCVSLKTIEKHRASIAKKLDVSSPVEMIKYAIRWDLVDADFWKS
ncbi:MAG: response regulator transcription factor [Desulfuromonadales bacterium]|nr:response regulator transcription factor [Desulfuromonadales bacterium]